MPVLPEFISVAEDMSGATIALSGDSRAVCFSALAALSALWQWTKAGGLDSADIDYIDALLSKANTELMRPMIGQTVMYITDDPPQFTLPCDGSNYLREDYPDLYAVIDPYYIVDEDNFIVPDLQSRSPIGAGSGSGLTTYVPNAQAGQEDHTLTASEMPIHYHGLFETTGLALAPGELPVLVPFVAALRNTDLAGGDSPHNTIHPVTAIKFAVYYS